MSSSDYEIHIDRNRFDSLWGQDDESEAFPFGEDMDSINKIINEELGSSRKRKNKKSNSR